MPEHDDDYPLAQQEAAVTALLALRNDLSRGERTVQAEANAVIAALDMLERGWHANHKTAICATCNGWGIVRQVDQFGRTVEP